MVAVLIAPAPRKPAPLPEIYCSCGRLLMRGILTEGSKVELYCKTCKRHVVFVAP